MVADRPADRGRDAIDLSTPRRLHVVGAGGAGMAPIAQVLAAMGHRLSGSDLAPSARLDRLAALGVEVHTGHSESNIAGAEALVVSTAVPATNPEVVAARARGVPVFSRATALAAIAATRRTVAVAGTHGKTTTSAMLATILSDAGLRPSFVVGGDVLGLDSGGGARWDDGEWLVIEADESDGTFLDLSPEIAIVTSVEPDHLEHYGDFSAELDAFDRFLAAVPGSRVVCGDDPEAARLAANHGATTYGTGPESDYRIGVVDSGRWGVRFTVARGDAVLGEIALPVPGLHNALNATAALVAAIACGTGFEPAAAALSRFGGVARRFQPRGERGGVTVVEDYAHLPAEVTAAVATALAGGWGRVVSVFQPHRYSRTAALGHEFAGAFDGVDVLVVTGIYSAGEEPRPGVSGKRVVEAVLDRQPHRRVAWFPTEGEARFDAVVAFLRRELRAGDLCLVLGAGDISVLPDRVLASVAGRP